MANEIRTRIAIDGEKAYKQSIDNIVAKGKELQSELNAISSEFAKNTTAQEKNKKAAANLQAQIENQKKLIAEASQRYNDAQKRLAELADEVEKAKKDFGENSTEVKKAEQNYRTFETSVSKLKTGVNNATAELNSMERELRDTENGTKDWNAAMESAGKTGISLGDIIKGNIISEVIMGGFRELANLAGEAAQAFADFMKSTVGTGAEFDTEISQLAATMGVATDAVTDLRDKAVEMGEKTKFTASEAAQGMNILALAGLNADDIMAGLPTLLDFAAAGALDLESAASYVTGAVFGWGDSMENAARYADLMAKGATLAKTDVNDLGAAMSSIAATANAFGQEAETTELAILRLAQANVTGEEATTYLKTAMTRLYAPTNDAAEVLAALGVSAFTSSGEARDFNDVITDLNAAMSNLTDEQKASATETIFGMRGMMSYNDIIATSTEQTAAWAAELAKAGGTAEQMAATQLDNLEGDITIFNSAMDGLKITLYDGFKGVLRGIVQEGTESIYSLKQAFIDGGLDGLLAELEVQVTAWAQKISEHLPQFLQVAITLIEGLGAGFIAALPTILPMIVDVILQLVHEFTANIDKFVYVAVDIIMALAMGLVDALPDLINAIPVLITALCDAIIQHMPEILQMGVKLILALAQGIIAAVSSVIAAADGIIKAVMSIFTSLADSGKVWGKDLIANFINGIKAAFSNLVETLRNVAQTVRNFLGFSEPKLGPLSNFHTYAPDMMKLFAQGITDNKDLITDAIGNSFAINPTISASMVGSKSAGAINYGGFNIAVYGGENATAQDIADEVMYKIQYAVQRREAVFA